MCCKQGLSAEPPPAAIGNLFSHLDIIIHTLTVQTPPLHNSSEKLCKLLDIVTMASLQDRLPVLSDEQTGLSQPILSGLKDYLNLQLSGPESNCCSNNPSTRKISIAVQSADLEDTMMMDAGEELDLEEEDDKEESKLEKEIEVEAETDPDVQELEEACAVRLNLDEEGSLCDDGHVGPSSSILTDEGVCVGHHGATAFQESEPDEDFSQEMAAVSSCSMLATEKGRGVQRAPNRL
ncbi:hypothetical protein EDD15DRAFT_2198397 [Pisolithus albus]|nr:hypothetical protein EDD15DRAFT_2198397 [Pisolithus albus]